MHAVAGTIYRIAVAGKHGAEGAFHVELRGRPGNDDFGSATEAWGRCRAATAARPCWPAPSRASRRTRGLARIPLGLVLVTAAADGPVDLSACSGGIDTLLAVYTGSAVNALIPVASNDDAPGPPPNELCEFSRGNSEVVIDAVAGTTYRIAVDGKGGSVGRFGLAFERAPSNDDFSAPQSLSTGLPSYGSAVTKLATKQAGEPNHAGDAGGHSVWFAWTPSSSGQVTISTCAYYGDLDPAVAVYTGSAVDSLTPVVSAADDPPGSCRSAGSEAQFNVYAAGASQGLPNQEVTVEKPTGPWSTGARDDGRYSSGSSGGGPGRLTFEVTGRGKALRDLRGPVWVNCQGPSPAQGTVRDRQMPASAPRGSRPTARSSGGR